MSIPLATTTITVTGYRPQSPVDPEAAGYDADPTPPAVLATGVRAAITLPVPSRGERPADEVQRYALRCDPFTPGLSRLDSVTDDSTGIEYEVETAMVSPYEGLGLKHITATIKRVSGIVSDGA